MTIEDTITVTPLTPAIGAEVAGIDLAKELDDVAFRRLHQAALDHLVLYLPGQDMPPPAQIALTERFGAVEPHPLEGACGSSRLRGAAGPGEHAGATRRA